MSELLSGAIESHEPPQISKKRFFEVLRKWTTHPWHDDTGLAAFSEVIVEAIPDGLEEIIDEMEPDISGEIFDQHGLFPQRSYINTILYYLDDIESPGNIDFKTNIDEEYIGRKLYHAVRHVWRLVEDEDWARAEFTNRGIPLPERPSFSYLEGGDNPEAYREVLELIASNATLSDALHGILLFNPIRTTVIQRYSSAFQGLLQEHGPKRPLRLADLGTGGAFGPRAMMKGEPFKPVKVYRPVDSDASNPESPILEIDSETTRRINTNTQMKLNIELFIGMDIYGIDDPAQKKWMTSSLLLREHRDEKKMADYEEISNYNDERLLLVPGIDVTNRGSVLKFISAFFDKYGEMPNLDAVFIYTMRYQQKSSEAVETLYNNAKELLHKNGCIYEQEFSYGSGGQPWGYVVRKWYPHRPDSQPEIIGYWKDDRCEELIIPEGSPLQMTP